MSAGMALLLGIVQGLTEFLPVSSSGHLVLIQTLSGVDVEGGFMFFDLLLHLGTLVSVFVAFWDDIKDLVTEFFKMIRDGFRLRDIPERRFIVLILISLIPMFLILPIKSKIETLFSSPVVVGIFLLVTALLLFVSDRIGGGKKDAASAKPKDALVVGLMQCLAVIPGLSRSGSTMAGGLFRGFKRDFAVKFAFIMSIPVILGANILSVGDAIASTTDFSQWPLWVIGTVAAAVTGYAAIRLVKLLVSRKGFTMFAVYCVVIGIITILLNIF